MKTKAKIAAKKPVFKPVPKANAAKKKGKGGKKC